MSADERFCFLVEWYDNNAALIRKYQLFYYPKDSTIEMFDPKNHKVFLRRAKAENVTLADLYIGSTINVLSRQLHFVDYGDEYTARRLCAAKERTFGMIKPDAIGKVGQIIDLINQHGLRITKLKMVKLDRKEGMDFYGEAAGKLNYNEMVEYISSGPVVAMEIMGDNAVSKWRDLLGPDDAARARSEASYSIRARFGSAGNNTSKDDNIKNAAYGSESLQSMARDMEFFFPSGSPGPANTACHVDCTCCIIKPHAFLEGCAGSIINKITEAGFEISAMMMFNLEKANAEEFLEVYKGVVQEYPAMVKELTSGPCLVLEIRAQNATTCFREFVGPADPEIARHLRPRTLRAMFGKNKIQNGVHCTDLPEDGQLEVEYFFKILDR